MRGNMAQLLDTLPQIGALEQILLRPARGEPMVRVAQAEVRIGLGLVGDRFSGRPDSKRQITLFQAEHLPVLASLLHRDRVDPALLRRNLLIRGISLHALSGRRFRIGSVLLEGAAQCHPCSRMERVLGPGGFNAMRGIGGLCVKVLEEGWIAVGDAVAAEVSGPGAAAQIALEL
jgi:MOSC domain-containing protein YiiM